MTTIKINTHHGQENPGTISALEVRPQEPVCPRASTWRGKDQWGEPQQRNQSQGPGSSLLPDTHTNTNHAVVKNFTNRYTK